METAMVNASGHRHRVGPVYFPAPQILSAGLASPLGLPSCPWNGTAPGGGAKAEAGGSSSAGRRMTARGNWRCQHLSFSPSPSTSPSSLLELPAELTFLIPAAQQHCQLQNYPSWWLCPASLLFGRISNLGPARGLHRRFEFLASSPLSFCHATPVP